MGGAGGYLLLRASCLWLLLPCLLIAVGIVAVVIVSGTNLCMYPAVSDLTPGFDFWRPPIAEVPDSDEEAAPGPGGEFFGFRVWGFNGLLLFCSYAFA